MSLDREREIAERLKDLSFLTGGKAAFPDKFSQYYDFMKNTAEQLRYATLIGFIPSGVERDGKMHTIKVKVSQSENRANEPEVRQISYSQYYYAKKQ